MATVRAQLAVALHPAFATGAFVAQEGLEESVNLMLDQVIAWAEALRGISKAEFSVLVELWRADRPELRVGELAESLDWDKSRVAHQLTRMEKRGFVERTEYGADGRRAGIRLTAEGRRAAESAIEVHAGNIRRHALEALTTEQAAVIRTWSEQTVERLERLADGDS